MAKSNLLVYALYGLSVTAILSMHGLARRNGTLEYRDQFILPGSYLPNTSIPIQAPQTGVKALDKYASLMLAIFWVDLDPRNVVAHIQGTHFLGTLSGTWLLLLVEAHRVDASLSFLLKTYVMETVGELIGLGFLTPLWCVVHISNFAVAGSRRMPWKDAVSLPFAVALGHGIPTVGMILGDPAGEGWYSQQNWVLLRLFHPVFTWGIWIVLRNLFSSSGKTVSSRTWYVTAIVVASTLHIVALAPILMTRLAAGWLTSDVIRQLDLWAIFVPPAFWEPKPRTVSGFAQGVSFFLQWDETLTAVAILLWSLSQYVQMRSNNLDFRTILYLGMLVALGGPVAAAAYLLLEAHAKDDDSIVEQDIVKQ